MKNTTKILVLLSALLAGAAEAVTDTFTASGTWIAPAGVTSVTVEAWGGGGAGGGATSNNGPFKGGGGAGGQYATGVVPVTPGTPYAVTVGTGGTGSTGSGLAGGASVFGASLVGAQGGAGGVSYELGGGAGIGSIAGGVGSTVYAGGSGSTGGATATGGAGGGGAGSTGPGGSAAGNTAGTGTALGGGTGGAGRTTGGNGMAGALNGGGGGGGYVPAGSTRNRSGGAGAAGRVTITYTLPPAVVSINCAAGCTTNAASVSWTVVFDQSVTGVDAADFTLVPGGGVTGASITGVTGGGTTWTVTVNTGSGTGTLGLNLVDDDSIANGSGQPLGGAGAGNGNFTGQVHTLDKTAPAVTSMVRNNPSPTALASVSWTVTFSENVTGVDTADFALVQGGGVGGALITAVAPVSGTTYTVTASTGAGNGTLGINLVDDDSIIDAASNPLGGAGAGNGDFTGEVYSIVRPVTITASPTVCINVAGIGTKLWTTAAPNDPLASDNLYATASVTDNETTNYLQCTGYGFNIPAGATINGITVYVERSAVNTTLIRDAAMRLVRDVAGVATIQATDRSTLTNYTATDVIEAHGGGADLWGAAWTAADINNANFGAAFASIKAGTAGGARTVRVDHMSISVDYTSPFPAVVSLNLASADPTAPATSVSWTVTFSESVSGVDAADFALAQAGGVSGAAITGVSGAGTTWTVTANTGSGAGTLGLNLVDNDSIVNALSIPLGGPGAGNGDFTGQVYTVLPAEAGSFNACDVGTACTGVTPPTYLRTKIAGAAFSLDLVALNADGTRNTAYTNTVSIELLDGSDYSGAVDANGCRSTWLPIATLSPNPVFTALNAGLLTVGPFNIPNAYRDVRVRVTNVGGPPRRGCSTDNFAIRPQSLTVVSSNANADGTGANPGAVPAIRAGTGFSLTATALAGYNGTPQVNTLLVDAHAGAVATGTPAGDFAAASPVSGAATGTAFTYSEAGYFRFQPYGVFDSSYTGVDQPSGCRATDSCDCAAAPNNFSNTLVGGRYGCDFGNTASTVFFGRFIPDHFDTAVVATATVPMPCPAGLTCPVSFNGFVYSGQPFSVQVTARNLAGGATVNYDGATGFSKNVTLSAWNAPGGATQNPGPGALANNAVASAAFVSGVGTTAAPAYTFNASPTAPADVHIRANESASADGVSSLRAVPAASVEGGVKVVSGRARIGSAHGSELLPLPMTATVQYWSGANWLTSLTDSVTSLTLGLSNYQSKTGGAWTTTPTPAIGQPIAGILQFSLSQPTGGGTGSVDVGISAPAYLLSGSNGAGVNPSREGRATFGVYKGSNEFIYLREVY